MPKNCLECQYVENMGDKVAKAAARDHCKKNGWDVKMSLEDMVKCSGKRDATF